MATVTRVVENSSGEHLETLGKRIVSISESSESERDRRPIQRKIRDGSMIRTTKFLNSNSIDSEQKAKHKQD